MKGAPVTMISPSSALGMLASWICLTATVSPVVQLRAPDLKEGKLYAQHMRTSQWPLTVDLAEGSFAKEVAELLQNKISRVLTE